MTSILPLDYLIFEWKFYYKRLWGRIASRRRQANATCNSSTCRHAFGAIVGYCQTVTVCMRGGYNMSPFRATDTYTHRVHFITTPPTHHLLKQQRARTREMTTTTRNSLPYKILHLSITAHSQRTTLENSITCEFG